MTQGTVVLEEHGGIVGWANLSAYRPRACYAGIAEFSIYVDAGARGKGVGRRLLDALERLIPENLTSSDHTQE